MAEKKETVYDENWLQDHKPYFIEEGYCLFSYDNSNWAVAPWRDNQVNKNKMQFYGSIRLAINSFIEKAYIRGKEFTSIKDLLMEDIARLEEFLGNVADKK